MDEPLNLLLVEDDPAIVEIVRLGLSYEGVEVTVAADGLEAIRTARETQPDLVVLDLMLPEVDGFEVLERIRARADTPVIFLTAKDQPADRVAGLQAGADDYVTKPFYFPELVARIRAVLRRRASGPHEAIEVADLRVDPVARRVMRAGEAVELTAKQFELLEFLARHAGRVLPKRRIYESVWGSDYLENPNVIEQHISHLRDRIDRGRASPLIHTVRGAGYVLRQERRGR